MSWVLWDGATTSAVEEADSLPMRVPIAYGLRWIGTESRWMPQQVRESSAAAESMSHALRERLVASGAVPAVMCETAKFTRIGQPHMVRDRRIVPLGLGSDGCKR